MPDERDHAGGEQHDGHELQPVLDMTDEQQLDAHAGGARDQRDEQEPPQPGKPLPVRCGAGVSAGHEIAGHDNRWCTLTLALSCAR